MNEAKYVHSFNDYINSFGGLWKKSNMSYAVYHYFLIGGKDAVIVRVYNPMKRGKRNKKKGKAVFTITGSNLKFEATNPGRWGKNLEITIDYNTNTANEDKEWTGFNLAIEDKTTGICESFPDLSTKIDNCRFIRAILQKESNLIHITGDVPNERPPEGTTKDNTQLPKIISIVEESANDGDPVEDSNIIGNPKDKTGIYALEGVDFNLLCIPPYVKDEIPSENVYSKALDYCESRRAILIVDPPKSWNSMDKPKDLTVGIDSSGFQPKRHKNAAIYFPRIKAADPEKNNRIREFVPCGAVAGVIAQTDIQRGIWKSPAGIETTLIGVSDLALRLTDEENGELNQLGINSLRIMPGIGPVVWGARTMMGADIISSQWKYLSVRRLALYIEESLYRGTQWVVFEPNNETLWSQIRLNVSAFMRDLFRRGAFQGSTSTQAYFVKCDNSTTTDYDVNLGIINIIVGFAPLKPEEFVILKIQQIACQETK